MPMSSAVFAYAKLLDARVDGLSQALLLGALSVLFGALGLFLIGPAFFAAGFCCGRCNQCRRSERHSQ
ncbi:MAG: hypothetical protein EBS75_10735 [Betaproteobacteria bacterium]|nr:hypothetical protein [Betaproteobacteria bacterium]NDA53213.1 hypothetical protein [Betaproteobacteria bacterium]